MTLAARSPELKDEDRKEVSSVQYKNATVVIAQLILLMCFLEIDSRSYHAVFLGHSRKIKANHETDVADL
jgi:hypothetical protein